MSREEAIRTAIKIVSSEREEALGRSDTVRECDGIITKGSETIGDLMRNVISGEVEQFIWERLTSNMAEAEKRLAILKK